MAILNEDEERYDRQIRLWGAEAQNNLRQAKILVIGITGLGSEIIKNVVLSGVNSMTLVDNRKLSQIPEDSGVLQSQMLLSFDQKKDCDSKSIAELSLPRCYELNPNVNTTAIPDIPFQEIENSTYHIVICCDQDTVTELKISESCSKSNNNNGVPFLAGATAGYFGQAIIDCGKNYSCQVEKPKVKDLKSENLDKRKAPDSRSSKSKDEPEEEIPEEDKWHVKTFSYPNFAKTIENLTKTDHIFSKLKKREIKNLNQAVIFMNMIKSNIELTDENAVKFAEKMTSKKDFFDQEKNFNLSQFHNLKELEYSCNGQLAAVTAIVGGFMAQEVIRVASKKEQPFENVFLFDGLNYKGDLMKV